MRSTETIERSTSLWVLITKISFFLFYRSSNLELVRTSNLNQVTWSSVTKLIQLKLNSLLPSSAHTRSRCWLCRSVSLPLQKSRGTGADSSASHQSGSDCQIRATASRRSKGDRSSSTKGERFVSDESSHTSVANFRWKRLDKAPCEVDSVQKWLCNLSVKCFH